MAEIAVGLAIEAVKLLGIKFIEQLHEHSNLIQAANEQMTTLEKDIKFLTDYMKEGAEKRKSNNFIQKALLSEVRDNIYKAEDAIDCFKLKQPKSYWRPITEPSISSADIVKRIIDVAKSVSKIRQEIKETQVIENEGFPGYEGDPPRELCYCSIFVEEGSLKQLLTQDEALRPYEAKQVDVILLSGVRCIGKTALAAKMFRNPEIQNHFTEGMIIWAEVYNPTAENILRVILRKLEPETVAKEMPCELRNQVRSILKQKKFLLVLDKVPKMSEEDYEELQRAFEESDKGSKVLITTTSPDGFSKYDSLIVLNELKSSEKLKVLQWQLSLSGVPYDSQRDVDVGLIAEKCEDLPIEIISTAKDLAKKLQLGIGPNEKKLVWENFIVAELPFKESSYDELPYNLRPCFLYLGIFPSQSKIPVSKLIQMWIAEQFITRTEDATLEETAENYLKQLVDRKLVKTEEKNLNGSAKTCSITESTRKFCQKESAQENILQEFKEMKEGFYPSIDEVKKNRRVCVHDHISKFIPKFISTSKQEDSFQICLRSFVSHSKEVFSLHKDDISKIRAAFRLLRVLDAKPIKVDKIHSGLCQLVHLRYVTLSLSKGSLPESISKLEKVQTLIVHTTSSTLKIEADLLAMAELSHFETDASATLSKKSETSEKDERLQTFYGISPKSCTTEFFKKLPNLKKLGICGQLALLLHDKKKDLLSQLEGVNKLKLLNQEETKETKWNTFKGKTSQNHEAKLSSQILQRLHPSLTRLTLSNTRLDWKHMSILGSLHELEELKLKDNAFLGKEWVVREGFPKLQTLKIESLEIELWKCSSAPFQKLRRLTLSKCKQLKEIPVELAYISAFLELHLHNGDIFAIESAKRIHKIKQQKKQPGSDNVFKLLPEDIFE